MVICQKCGVKFWCKYNRNKRKYCDNCVSSIRSINARKGNYNYNYRELHKKLKDKVIKL